MRLQIMASKEQLNQIYLKHLKPSWLYSKIKTIEYYQESERGTGYVTIHTTTDKRITFQLNPRGTQVAYADFEGFGNTYYTSHYPEKDHSELHSWLLQKALKARENFWKGSQI